jgi:hypothetical protein
MLVFVAEARSPKFQLQVTASLDVEMNCTSGCIIVIISGADIEATGREFTVIMFVFTSVDWQPLFPVTVSEIEY